MSKKNMWIIVATMLMLSACDSGSVDKSVDKSENVMDNTVDNGGYSTQLSTQTDADVDKTVDNSQTVVENSIDSVEDYEDELYREALAQAEEYFYYYSSECALHKIKSDIIFSSNKFFKAWRSEENSTLDDYYIETGWFDRGEYMSLQFMPRECMFDRNCDDVYQWMARCIRGYLLAKQKYSGDELWKNEASLIPQYQCHALYAGSKKTPWYIEPHRTETNFLVILSAKGNPEP